MNGGLNRTASIAPVAVCWNDRQSHALLTTGKEAFALGTLACKLTPMEHRHPIHPRSDRTRTMVRGHSSCRRLKGLEGHDGTT